MPAVRKIVRDAKRDNYKFSATRLGDRDERTVPDAAGAGSFGAARCDGANGFDEARARRRNAQATGDSDVHQQEASFPSDRATRQRARSSRCRCSTRWCPAMAANSKPTPQRLAFVGFPHGAVMRHWSPEQTGKDYPMTKILEPLAPYRQASDDRLGTPQQAGREPRAAPVRRDARGSRACRTTRRATTGHGLRRLGRPARGARTSARRRACRRSR